MNGPDSRSGLGHVDELTTTCRSGVRGEIVTADGALGALDTCAGRVIIPSCRVTVVSDDSNSESRWGTGRSESESGGEDSGTGWGTDDDGATADSRDLDTPESDSDHLEQDRKRAQMYRRSRRLPRGRSEIGEFRDERWTPSTKPASVRCPRAADERRSLSNHLTPG